MTRNEMTKLGWESDGDYGGWVKGDYFIDPGTNYHGESIYHLYSEADDGGEREQEFYSLQEAVRFVENDTVARGIK